MTVGLRSLVVLVVAAALVASSEPARTPTPAPSSSPTTPSFPPSSLSPTLEPSPTVGSPPFPSPGTVEPLAVLVALLRIEPEHRAGYERSLFVHWIDADGDGCDTRREVLILESLMPPAVGSHCSLTGGRWVSLYDGLVFTDIADLQIDHVVALAEAWDSGAWSWTPARREAFANDIGEPWELIAVSGASNEAKADSDPADWLPPLASAECPFLDRYIAAKVRWNLAIDDREHGALVREITDCPEAAMPFVPAP